MEYRRGGLALVFTLVIFSLLALFPLASANFACGALEPLNPEFSPSWFDIKVYYTEKPQDFTTCKVSPDDYKFCCDPREIDSVNWQIGKELNAQVLSNDFTSNTVSLSISGEGFDVFPKIFPRKTLSVFQPSREIYTIFEEIPLNISTQGLYNISYILNKSSTTLQQETLCTNCNLSFSYLTGLSAGDYTLLIKAENSQNSLSEKREFKILSDLEVKRKLTCSHCSQEFVRSNVHVTLDLTLETSSEIQGVFFDIFPKEWVFVSAQGNYSLESFSETHNKISWQVSPSTSINKSYILRSPALLLPRSYNFQSGINNFEKQIERIIVYRFWKFFPFSSKFSERIPSYVLQYQEFSQLSPQNPAVMFSDYRGLTQVSIFPKNATEDEYVYITKTSPVRLQRASHNFVIGTSMDPQDIQEILIDFKVRKPRPSRFYTTQTTLYQYNLETQSWFPLNSTLQSEDEIYLHYRASSDFKGIFSIKTQRTRI